MADFDPEADAAAFSKQYDADKAAKAQQEAATTDAPQHPLMAFANWATSLSGRVSTAILEKSMHAAGALVNTAADAMDTAGVHVGAHAMRDIAAGGAKGVATMADTVHSAVVGAARMLPGDPNAADPTGPIWDHAKQTIQDFTDAVKVKDPTIADDLLQFTAQVVPAYSAASRMLSGLHGVANVVGAGVIADATAIEPGQPRFADMLATLKQTDGKLGAALRAAGPYGLNAYINYLAHTGPETEAQAHFKNALDGILPNFLGTELLHAAGITAKQGYRGIRYAIDNGVGSAGDFAASGSRKAQRGAIGWHGTPHDFDTEAGFKNEAIGSGEGAQVYGYGHYLAEDPAVAGHYQQTLTAGGRTSAALRLARSSVIDAKGDEQKAFENLTKMAGAADHQNDVAHYQTAAQIVKAGNAKRGGGSMVKAEVDDAHVANMLDWDEPISKQPKIVQETLAAHGLTDPDMMGKAAYRKLSTMLTPAPLEGSDYFSRGDEGSRAASALLNFRGVPGIRYLDAGSRRSGGGTRNLVVFDGKNIKVLEKAK